MNTYRITIIMPKTHERVEREVEAATSFEALEMVHQMLKLQGYDYEESEATFRLTLLKYPTN